MVRADVRGRERDNKHFTENVIMGVYTGRLFNASTPIFEDFGILKSFGPTSMFVPSIVLRSRNFSSTKRSLLSPFYMFGLALRGLDPAYFGPIS
jgi:hypothetical protein